MLREQNIRNWFDCRAQAHRFFAVRPLASSGELYKTRVTIFCVIKGYYGEINALYSVSYMLILSFM